MSGQRVLTAKPSELRLRRPPTASRITASRTGQRVLTAKPSELRLRRPPTSSHITTSRIGGRTDGYLSREEARQQQTEQYLEDRRKFAEKKKQKEDKKREEKWKRYEHVRLGQRLDDSADQMEHVDSVRERQQSMYEIQSEAGLEIEREREVARLKREQQKKEEKLKRYAHVDTGSRLNNSEECGELKEEEKKEEKWERNADSADQMEHIDSVRERQQSMYKIQSQAGLEIEREREVARLKREQQKKEEKLKRYAHVDTGRKLNNSKRSGELKHDLDLPIRQLDRDIRDLNLNLDCDRAMEKKDSMYQGKQLFENKTSSACTSGTFQGVVNDLNRESSNQNQNEEELSAEKEAELNRQMRLARERLQQKYNESKKQAENQQQGN